MLVSDENLNMKEHITFSINIISYTIFILLNGELFELH